eukprot:419108-Karenia_brevis.AAC.1
MSMKSEQIKSKISATQPLAVRIDGCTGAISRGQKRLQFARQALKLATQAVAEAEDYIAQKSQQLQ